MSLLSTGDIVRISTRFVVKIQTNTLARMQSLALPHEECALDCSLLLLVAFDERNYSTLVVLAV